MPARPTNEPNNYIAFAKQADKDTEGATFVFLKHLDGSGFDADEDIQSVREGGDGQEVGFRHKSALKTTGKFALNSRPEIGGRMAAAVLGADSASVVTASGAANALVFHRAVPAPTIPYFTVEQAWADDIEKSTAVKFTTLDISGDAGGLLKIDTDFVSGGSYYGGTGAQTPTRESADPHSYIGATVMLDGAQNKKVTKFKVSVKRGVDDGIQTTGLNNEDVVETNFDVDIDATLKYEDRTLYQKIKRGGGSQVPLNLATGALMIVAPNGNPSFPLKVGIPVFDYTGAKVNRLDPDGKTCYIDVSAMTRKNATTTIYIESFSGASAAY